MFLQGKSQSDEAAKEHKQSYQHGHLLGVIFWKVYKSFDVAYHDKTTIISFTRNTMSSSWTKQKTLLSTQRKWNRQNRTDMAQLAIFIHRVNNLLVTEDL